MLHPSDNHIAKLAVARDGFWKYTCSRIKRPLSLAELRGALANLELSTVDQEMAELISNSEEGLKRPGRIEISRWLEQLDYEAGLLLPEEVPIILPTRLTPLARAVGGDIGLFLGLRHRMWGREPFTYSRRFCMARLKLPLHQARAAVEELVAVGVILRVEVEETTSWRDPYRYKLGLPEGRTVDQVADMLVYEFDAVEEEPGA